MEDPIRIPISDDVNLLPIPPMDLDFLTADFDAEIDGGDFVGGVDLDFSFDDLEFVDDLLIEQPQSEIPNPNFEQNLSNSEVRVHDCLNQGSVSSEESNFGWKLNSSSLNSPNFNDGSPNLEQNRISDEIRVYDCSKPASVSSEESNFGDKSNFHLPNLRNLGNNCDRDASSTSSADNNSRDQDKSSESSSLKRKIKAEEMIGSKNNSLSKRKREQEQFNSADFNVGGDEDDKRKARLVRNRESAQLSRQRKKQYVEELEVKVKSMHSAITDLNCRISYVMAENAALRQQLAGGAGAGAGVVPPPVMNGMYPMGMAPMPYPWMPCPPYMVKPQGSQVPLIPIPRLKPQQPVSSSKGNKKGESKKNERQTKKVASISLLGLLFFFLLFGGLLPMVNVRYGGSGEGFGVVPRGKVLMVDHHVDKVGYRGGTGIVDENLRHGRGLQQLNVSDGFGPPLGNCSEPLTASLYVPRNDKLLKMDGNLIIHSVLASEKAVASQTEPGVKISEETSLAIVRRYPPYPVPRPGKNDGQRPEVNDNSNGRQRAVGSSFSNQSKPVASDGNLQEWFREGLAGPMLSSGMCTEVFRFDVSPTPGSIVPATFISNTIESHRNSTELKSKPRNRKILKGHPIPLDGRALNDTTEENQPPHKQKVGLKTNTESSIVVSVLVDPREIGDGDGEGVIRSKTFSRIFVVVLIDSVKYVTYSCMLPFVGSGNHLTA